MAPVHQFFPHLLKFSRLKNFKILTVLLLISGALISGCKKDTFTENPGVCPLVLVTNPENQADGVLIDQVISVTFNVVMDPATINTSSFTVNGTDAVPGTISYSGATAFFTPSNALKPFTAYNCQLTTAVKDIYGNALQTNYIWTFTTGSAVAVVATNPPDQTTGVVLNSSVEATFRGPMNPQSITTTTFTLRTGATMVPGFVSYAGTTARFVPTANLLSGANYTATITTGVKDPDGFQMSDDYVWSFRTQETLGPPSVDLKTAARFGIMAGAGIDSEGFSKINNMDVGISPGLRVAVTGFPPALIVNGALYASDDIAPAGVSVMLSQAKQDLSDAYLMTKGTSSPFVQGISGDIGGQTLPPGIYNSTTSLLIQSGNLVLDAQGDANAVWVFQIADDLTTIGGSGGNVLLTGGAQAANVFWQAGNAVVIGEFTTFKGSVLAFSSITMKTGSITTGRMLALNGTVVLNHDNIINKP